MKSVALGTTLVLALCGCRTVEDSVGLPPFVEYVGARQQWYVRPFVAHRPGHVQVLWPIFRYRRAKEECSWWLLPVAIYTARWRHGGWDRDLYVMPLFAWGHSPREGTQLAFFPIWGRLTSFFGYDEATFVLFPAYLHLKDGEQESFHVLFPFVNWLKGGLRAGWRFWPFYAAYRARSVSGRPRYERTYVLWPFFSYHRNGLNTKAPATALLLFPFWGQVKSSRLTRTYVLWPLYSQEHDRTRRWRSYGMPLFPIRVGSGPQALQCDLWPVFGLHRREDRRGSAQRTYLRQFSLWPFQRYVRRESQEHRSWRFYLLPFWWESHLRWPQAGKRRTRYKLWPLFAKEYGGGSMHWEALSLLPWFDQEVDRFWGRFWTVARYARRGSARWFELLWGVFSWECDLGAETWRLFGGLFQAETKREGELKRSTYRLFFLPLFSTETQALHTQRPGGADR